MSVRHVASGEQASLFARPAVLLRVILLLIGKSIRIPADRPSRFTDVKLRRARMKSMLLGVFIALLTCCRAYAEINGYVLTPSDADVFPFSEYKFHVERIEGRVTSAELYVSPAARPIWNNFFDVYGSESNLPLLGDASFSYQNIGKRYVPRDLLFNSYWGLDVTDFMRSVKSPYVELRIYDALFTKGAYLTVQSFVPEPSSLAL
jgi:hypothetical protein